MAFRKHMALVLALAMVTICFGCADDVNAPAEDEQPVLPPTSLRAYALPDGDINISWAVSSSPTVTGYNLYRRQIGVGSAKKLNDNRLTNTEYHDVDTTPATDYEYRVTAVSASGKESRFRSVVIGTRSLAGDGGGRVPSLNGE